MDTLPCVMIQYIIWLIGPNANVACVNKNMHMMHKQVHPRYIYTINFTGAKLYHNSIQCRRNNINYITDDHRYSFTLSWLYCKTSYKEFYAINIAKVLSVTHYKTELIIPTGVFRVKPETHDSFARMYVNRNKGNDTCPFLFIDWSPGIITRNGPLIYIVDWAGDTPTKRRIGKYCINM